MAFDPLSFIIGQQTAKSGGSSGGAVPAGAYFYRPEIKTKNYHQQWVEYKGEIYAFRNTMSGNTSTTTVEKLVDGEWTTLITECEIVFSNMSVARIHELNGVLHLMSSTRHYVFDGETVTQKANLPSSSSDTSAVAGGKLYSYYANKEVFLEWDENTDTWTQTSFGSSYVNRYMVGVGDYLYLIESNGNLTRYENGALTTVTNLNNFSASFWKPFAFNNCIYFANGENANTAGKLYKYNIADGTQKFVGGMLKNITGNTISVIRDKILFLYGDSANSKITPLFLLEVEGAE